MWEEARVPRENQRVQAGDHLLHTTIVNQLEMYCNLILI